MMRGYINKDIKEGEEHQWVEIKDSGLYSFRIVPSKVVGVAYQIQYKVDQKITK